MATKRDHAAQYLPSLEESSLMGGIGAILQQVGNRDPRAHLHSPLA